MTQHEGSSNKNLLFTTIDWEDWDDYHQEVLYWPCYLTKYKSETKHSEDWTDWHSCHQNVLQREFPIYKDSNVLVSDWDDWDAYHSGVLLWELFPVDDLEEEEYDVEIEWNVPSTSLPVLNHNHGEITTEESHSLCSNAEITPPTR